MYSMTLEVISVFFGDAEKLLNFWSLASVVWVIDLIRIELFHLFFCNKTTLMSEPLLGQVLSAIVSDLLFVASEVLLVPIGSNLKQAKSLMWSKLMS